SGLFDSRMKPHHDRSPRTGRASRIAVRIDALSRATATPSTANAHAGFSTPSTSANTEPSENSTSATTNDQKYRSRANPNGCSAVGERAARRPPRKSNPWLPVSAAEWMASASSDAAPVKANATTFDSAMPRLARNAAAIARRLPSCMERGCPGGFDGEHGGRGDGHELTRAGLEPHDRRGALEPDARSGRVLGVQPARWLPAHRELTAATEVEPFVAAVPGPALGVGAGRLPDADALGAEAVLEGPGPLRPAELEGRVDEDAGEGPPVVGEVGFPVQR